MSALPQLEPNALAQEIWNRFRAIPARQRLDALAVIMRLTVEVTREWLQHHPEGVDEFLRFARAYQGSTH